MGPRRLLALVAFALSLVAMAAPAHAASGPDAGAEARFVSLTNGARAGAGLGGLAVSDDLVALARQHSIEMANSGSIYHTSDLGSRVGGWTTIAENVGRGSNPDVVHNALMSSAPHRANILDARFSQIGVGVAWNGPTLYVTEIFRQPSGARPAPAPAPRKVAAAPRPVAVAPPPPPPPLPSLPALPALPTTTTTAPPSTTTTAKPAPTHVVLASRASTSSWPTGPFVMTLLGAGLIAGGVKAGRSLRRRSHHTD
jgi:hypothetical protein